MASSVPTADAALHGVSMAENNGGEVSGEDLNQHSDTQLSDKQVQDPDVTASVPPDSTGDSTFPADASGNGAAEYDPAVVLTTPEIEDDEDEDEEEEGEEGEEDSGDAGEGGGEAEEEEAKEEVSLPARAASSQPPAKKPKAVGGFLVGDSDSEDDDSSAPAATGQPEPEYDPAQTSAPPNPSFGDPMVVQDADDSYDPSPDVAPEPLPPPVPAPDTVAVLEARVAGDPRGAVESWLALIGEHRRCHRFDEARAVFQRFLEVFPQAAEVWVDNLEMELELDNFAGAEDLFSKSLTKVLNVPLWVVYLDYVRRRNVLSDTNTDARTVVSRAYEFVLDNVGLDKESARIWQEYIQFIRSGPGTIGGSGWQDQQKMDQLRKAFRRATSIPISNVMQLWKEYDQFEMGLNKITGRKFLADRSPAYMTAKGANTALENLTRGLDRTTIPRLPPVAGFEGHQEYMTQVDLWKRWIAWEKSDPLEVKLEEPETYKARVLYCYKQALMPMRFWPELWVEAAEWCFENDVKETGKDQGLEFLVDGIAANPESLLLALKHADRIELTYPVQEGDEAKIARGQAVRAPYDQILKTLRDLHKSLQDREKAEVAKLEETLTANGADKLAGGNNADGDEDDDDDYADGSAKKAGAVDEEKEKKISMIKQGFAAQTDLVSKCLTHVWIALARAMRRIQGKGNPQGPVGGMRQVFYEARKGGRLKSDIYVAVAKMEWKCYNDKAGGKILERGAKLFPEDPYFMIEYIKYLTAHGDNTNSRVVFETCVNRLAQKPETVHKAKPLLAYMHKREAEYGDLARVTELEKRISELFPDDPKLALFSKRFSTEKFDPVGARIIISPGSQLRPRLILPSVERPMSVRNSPMPVLRPGNSPRIPYLSAAANSPKRPFPLDDFDEGNPPRKILRSVDQREFQRGESPLKGAAGRRLDQQRRMQGQNQGYGAVSSAVAPPAPLPTMVTFLLGQIPAAAQYNGVRVSAPGLVQLIRETDIDPNSWDSNRKSGGRSGRQTTPFGRHSGGGAGASHTRQVSSEYSQYGNRNSPGPSGGRHTGASGTYRQSSLRPDSRESYEPPPAPGQGGYGGQFGAPPAQTSYDTGSWQGQPPAGYGAPTYQQQQQPSQQSGSYGGYRYQ